MSNLTDSDLLNTFLSDPNSTQGQAALQILEYRKHLEIMRNNRLLSILTVIMTISAVSQVLVDILK